MRACMCVCVYVCVYVMYVCIYIYACMRDNAIFIYETERYIRFLV